MQPGQEKFLIEYFQRKLEINEEIWCARDWFLHGVEIGSEQNYNKLVEQQPKQVTSCTQDEFKAKYGEHGEKYKPQTDPNVPWNPKWDNL
jgi:hypothetical protein